MFVFDPKVLAEVAKMFDEEDRKLSINQLSSEHQFHVIHMILQGMASLYGGTHHFFDAVSQQMIMQGWASGLGNLTIYQIKRITNYVMEGKHKYAPKPPRNPMEFLHLRNDINQHTVPGPDATYKMLEDKFKATNRPMGERVGDFPERTPEELERSKGYFQNMRDMLGPKVAEQYKKVDEGLRQRLFERASAGDVKAREAYEVDVAREHYENAKDSGDEHLIKLTRDILWQALGHA